MLLDNSIYDIESEGVRNNFLVENPYGDDRQEIISNQILYNNSLKETESVITNNQPESKAAASQKKLLDSYATDNISVRKNSQLDS